MVNGEMPELYVDELRDIYSASTHEGFKISETGFDWAAQAHSNRQESAPRPGSGLLKIDGKVQVWRFW